MQRFVTMDDALSVAARILAGEVDPNLGCNMIVALASKLDNPMELMIFQLFALKQSKHEHLGITTQSCVPDILEACRELLAGKA